MLTEPLRVACPPQLRGPLTRFLADEISGEITLMHFALHLGGARALASTLESLVAAEPERGKLADLINLAAANSDHLTQITALVEGGLADPAAAGSGGVAPSARYSMGQSLSRRKHRSRSILSAPRKFSTAPPVRSWRVWPSGSCCVWI
jgi:hypothetical protein